jgi:hypothetical protein
MLKARYSKHKEKNEKRKLHFLHLNANYIHYDNLIDISFTTHLYPNIYSFNCYL